MKIDGPNEEDYRHFLAHGGTVKFELDATDIDGSGEFEEISAIKPKLESGFKLDPSPASTEPTNAAALYLYGGSWVQVVNQITQRRGELEYRRLKSGRYEATATISTDT